MSRPNRKNSAENEKFRDDSRSLWRQNPATRQVAVAKPDQDTI
jgi:hypothetical protein